MRIAKEALTTRLEALGDDLATDEDALQAKVRRTVAQRLSAFNQPA
jgi:hypothetical protein